MNAPDKTPAPRTRNAARDEGCAAGPIIYISLEQSAARISDVFRYANGVHLENARANHDNKSRDRNAFRSWNNNKNNGARFCREDPDRIFITKKKNRISWLRACCREKDRIGRGPRRTGNRPNSARAAHEHRAGLSGGGGGVRANPTKPSTGAGKRGWRHGGFRDCCFYSISPSDNRASGTVGSTHTFYVRTRHTHTHTYTHA